ncbi:nucleoside hydrolase [Cumulibacter soli]|uniref:nucleoside hydrolase n=1 Tax=Cumulibacter soli TaxID=2546344 RepID=UPI001067DA1D|nr:nucleoside hydrolase [Cumulibacter soli]
MKHVLLDCDPGIDDALALALLSGRDDVEIVAVTSVAGNVPLEVTTTNALRLLDFYGRSDIRVTAGAARPLARPNVFANHVHGEDGLGGAQLPFADAPVAEGSGADAIIEHLAARPGEITLLATGPMTNVALALQREPRIATWAKEVVLMGGAWTRGNITPAAEFNFYADPEAAAVVLEAEWRPVLTTLDLTLQARIDAARMDRWRTFGRLSDALLGPAVAGYFDSRSASGTISAPASYVSSGTGPAVHDAVAAAYVVAPELFTSLEAMTQVETQGELTAGMSVIDFGATRHNSEVLTGLDLGGFWQVLEDSFATLARRMQQR